MADKLRDVPRQSQMEIKPSAKRERAKGNLESDMRGLSIASSQFNHIAPRRETTLKDPSFAQKNTLTDLAIRTSIES